MADKTQPGRFTLRFNLNDPQQQAAVNILNRLGRQKAQFIAQALIHYTEGTNTPYPPAPAVMDADMLEQAILTVLAKHPSFSPPETPPSDPAEHRTPQAIPETKAPEPDPLSPVSPVSEDDFIAEDSLNAIHRTMESFWKL